MSLTSNNPVVLQFALTHSPDAEVVNVTFVVLEAMMVSLTVGTRKRRYVRTNDPT